MYGAHAALGEARAKAGSIERQASRLVKLAPAIGAGSEGGVHSRCRRALEEGVPRGALKQVAPLDFLTGAAALTWVEDVTDPGTRRSPAKA